MIITTIFVYFSLRRKMLLVVFSLNFQVKQRTFQTFSCEDIYTDGIADTVEPMN